MVHRGQPSKSCRQCRNRNIKCDKKRDSCGQCLRAKFTCPGYHDPKSLVFVNENKSVIQKATKYRIPVPVVPSVLERAKAMFVSRYVIGQDRDAPGFGFMVGFNRAVLGEKCCIAIAVRAVSLGYILNELGFSSHVWEEARRMYGNALVLTNEALSSPSTSKENTTLVTVLLLDLFEDLMNKSEEPHSSLESEAKHLEGALTLVKLRGPEQFADHISQRVFLRLSFKVLMNCFERSVVPPRHFITLYKQAKKYTAKHDPGWRFADLMVKITMLQASIEQGVLSESIIMGRVKEMQDEYFAIAASISTEQNMRGIVDRREEKSNGLKRFDDSNSFLVLTALLDRILKDHESKMLGFDALSPAAIVDEKRLLD